MYICYQHFLLPEVKSFAFKTYLLILVLFTEEAASNGGNKNRYSSH